MCERGLYYVFIISDLKPNREKENKSSKLYNLFNHQAKPRDLILFINRV